ncbi:phage tail tape measure protein [Escherichia coli]|uniref:phage tail tape measure protein n=1 Tax=Escherichia coli TaxID=562 RepID=UPI000DDE3440|nr:phage tail tape measure protein [Escherichia coli]
MASEFSVGVVIGGMIGSTFRSAMSGTRRALDSLNDTSRRLQERQNALTRATERYGQLGSSRMQRLNSELLQVSRTMEQIERQQRRLSAVSATGDALKANRMALYGQGAETYAIGRTLGAPVMASVKQYASFESQLRDISVTGDLDAKQERAIGLAIRQASLKVNQLQESLLGGVGQLVADGMDPERAATFAEMLGKTATATKADMADLAKMTYAFSDALRITDAKELEQAFGIAATGAKLGSFELKDMAKALPGLAKAFAARGIYGKDAITQIVASLEVGKGSGSAEEAVTNMSNWLAAMGRGDTIQKYAKAGVDYQGSMQNYVAQGFSQYEASLMIANRFIDGKGKAFLQQWKAAGSRGDQEGQQKLMESFGLAEVFTDIQTVNHLLSMRQGWDKYLSSKQKMNAPSAMSTLDKDAAKQNDTLEGRWRRMQIGVNDSAISIGQSLRPALIQLGETFIPLMDSVGKWIAANPQLVSSTIKVVGALLAFRMATIGLRLGLNLLFSPFVSVWKSAVLLRTNWLRLTTALGEGGKLRWLATGFRRLARGGLKLAKILAGNLARGIMIAARAVLFIGRALLINPIGLIVTGIAAAAYLLYRYWGPLSAFFKRLWAQVTNAFSKAWSSIVSVWRGVTGWFSGIWTEIKTAFGGGIAGVGRLVLNWSPLGLFHKAFAGVLSWFGIDMPESFTEFGGNLITGLVGGIGNKLTAAKETIVSFGSSISSWFKETLGIHSPSRVFMSFGDDIAQGAVIGLQRSTPLAAMAGQRLAAEMTPDVPRIPSPEILAAGYSGRDVAASGGGASGSIQVSFNPQFFLNGKETAAPAGLTGALNMSLHELEKILERLLVQKQRKEYR